MVLSAVQVNMELDRVMKAVWVDKVPMEILLLNMEGHKASECMSKVAAPATTIKARELDNTISSSINKEILITLVPLKADTHKVMKIAADTINLTRETKVCMPEDMKAGQIKIRTDKSGVKETAIVKDLETAIKEVQVTAAATEITEAVLAKEIPEATGIMVATVVTAIQKVPGTQIVAAATTVIPITTPTEATVTVKIMNPVAVEAASMNTMTTHNTENHREVMGIAKMGGGIVNHATVKVTGQVEGTVTRTGNIKEVILDF